MTPERAPLLQPTRAPIQNWPAETKSETGKGLWKPRERPRPPREAGSGAEHRTSATTRCPSGDERLIAGILQGDPGAFEALCDRYRHRILAFAATRLANPQEAEDVTQEVLLQVYLCLDRFEGRSSLLSWMLGIAYNRIRQRFKRQAPLPVALETPEVAQLQADVASLDDQIDAARILESCCRLLEHSVSPSQRRVFHLKHVENRSSRTIAKQLGVSRQAVNVSLFRTRNTLARHHSDLPRFCRSKAH